MTKLEWINIGGKYSFEADLRYGLTDYGMSFDVRAEVYFSLKWPLQNSLYTEIGAKIQQGEYRVIT